MWTWFLETFPTSASRLDCVDVRSFRPGCVSTRRPFRQTKWPPRRFEAWNLHFTHFAQGAPLFSPHEPQLEPEREKKTIPVTLQFALWASTQTNKKNKKTDIKKKKDIKKVSHSYQAPPLLLDRGQQLGELLERLGCKTRGRFSPLAEFACLVNKFINTYASEPLRRIPMCRYIEMIKKQKKTVYLNTLASKTSDVAGTAAARC